MKLLKFIVSVILCFVLYQGYSTDEKVYIDIKGIIRWPDSKEEVALIGANYCLPSACDYRVAKRMSIELKKDIITT